MAPTHGGVEVSGSTVLPDPSPCLEGLSVLESKFETLNGPRSSRRAVWRRYPRYGAILTVSCRVSDICPDPARALSVVMHWLAVGQPFSRAVVLSLS